MVTNIIMEEQKLAYKSDNLNPKNNLGSGVLLRIADLCLNFKQKNILNHINWEISKGESWLLSGESGSGKTSLAKVITGNLSVAGEVKLNFKKDGNLTPQVLYVDSWYQFKNIEGVANFYYQQRYTSQQAKETLTVNAELKHYGKEHQLDFELIDELLDALGFAGLKNAQLIELSSGEHKKLQLVKALWLKPQLLIIDQPYTGLDAFSRKSLNSLLNKIAAEGVSLILISNDEELPTCINRFAVLNNGNLTISNVRQELKATSVNINSNVPEFLKTPPVYASQHIAKMVDVSINYGDKQVLKNINWEIKAGDKWLLQGHNGSGKSTLLSLINGDHPQSYANNLHLFGKKRGSGESIWDIKQHIGLISPEFHWYFDSNSTVWESVASGLYDSVGLYKTLPFSKAEKVDKLIAFFGLSAVKNEILSTLPLGKQRLVLLARTIIKNPELLILDEPCQGLDTQQTQYFNQLVDELCNNGMTVIYVGHFESQLPNCLNKKIVLENGEVKFIGSISKNIEVDNYSTLVEQSYN